MGVYVGSSLRPSPSVHINTLLTPHLNTTQNLIPITNSPPIQAPEARAHSSTKHDLTPQHNTNTPNTVHPGTLSASTRSTPCPTWRRGRSSSTCCTPRSNRSARTSPSRYNARVLLVSFVHMYLWMVGCRAGGPKGMASSHHKPTHSPHKPQAGEIAARHGFEPREFDALLSKARGNALFRWRVNRLMGPTPAAAFGGGARGGAFVASERKEEQEW